MAEQVLNNWTREAMLESLNKQQGIWDVVVVGGGATGLGIALDAVTRGFSTLLLEQHDFGKGTSTRSTKLVHGGVRYLEQGNISLVLGALKERALMLQNAPHLVKKQSFVLPTFNRWGAYYFGLGLKFYDFLSGKSSLGPSHIFGRSTTVHHIPTIKTDELRGGVEYFDGQFDDARYLINLAQTAIAKGGTLLNYAKVDSLSKSDGLVNGLHFIDMLSNQSHEVEAKVVINATGVFVDQIRKMDDGAAQDMILASQGVHLVLSKRFLPGDSAILIPRTKDGRVLFAVPWLGHTVIGTTDTQVPNAQLEPIALEEEINFLIDHANEYLTETVSKEDVKSIFTGLRPLVKPAKGGKSSVVSRDHTIEVSNGKLITITGGKWTTYRKMAKDALDRAIKIGGLPYRKCITDTVELHGAEINLNNFEKLSMYGSDREALALLERQDPQLAERLHPDLPYKRSCVVLAARMEMAQSVEDVLARRTRMLFLNVKAALFAAPIVAEILASELNKPSGWQEEQIAAFEEVARSYQIETYFPPRQ